MADRRISLNSTETKIIQNNSWISKKFWSVKCIVSLTVSVFAILCEKLFGSDRVETRATTRQAIVDVRLSVEQLLSFLFEIISFFVKLNQVTTGARALARMR